MCIQLDHVVKQARGGKHSTEAQCLAFACDVLSVEAIKKAFDDILAAWPGKKIGTAVFNASIRKRGPFLEQRSEQVYDSVQASM